MASDSINALTDRISTFRQRCFRALIVIKDNTIQTGAAGNLYIFTLDFAKLGLLVANKGKWRNKLLADYYYMNRLLSEHALSIGDYNPLSDGYGIAVERS